MICVQRSRSGQNRRHGRYRYSDRTRHYGHRWLLGRVPRSRRGRYKHHTVNHTTGFADERTAACSNTIASTWCHVKAFLSPYNRKGDYIHHLAHYMFAVRCRAEKMDQFTRFLRHNRLERMSNLFRIADRLPTAIIATYLFTASPGTGKRAWEQLQHIPCRFLGDSAPHSAECDIVGLFFQVVPSHFGKFLIHAINTIICYVRITG